MSLIKASHVFCQHPCSCDRLISWFEIRVKSSFLHIFDISGCEKPLEGFQQGNNNTYFNLLNSLILLWKVIMGRIWGSCLVKDNLVWDQCASRDGMEGSEGFRMVFRRWGLQALSEWIWGVRERHAE